MKMNTFLSGFLLTGIFSAASASVELKNSEVTIRILPERGGSIVFLRGRTAEFDFSQKELSREGIGLCKERIFGDSAELTRTPWRLLKSTPRSVTLQTGGSLPHRTLEITKTFTLPEKGAYIRVDLKFRNSNPVAGGYKIIPWIHHGFPIRENADGSTQRFFLSHKKGIETADHSQKVIRQPTIRQTGNWSAYFNEKEKRGLLMVSEKSPEVFYDFIAPRIATMEMLFHAVEPVPEACYTYYLAPISALTEKEIAALSLPAVLKPSLNAQTCPGEKVNLVQYFKDTAEKNIPVNFRYWKSAAYVSPDVTLPLTFGVRNTGGGILNFEVDLPDFVSLEGYTGDYWWMVNEEMKLISRKPVEHDGKKFTRCRFAVSAKPMQEWYPNHCRLFLKSNLSSATGTIYYRGIRNGRTVMEEMLPCEVIRIPQARIPGKFKLLFGLDYSLWKNYPDFNANMKHLGVNGLCFNYNIPNQAVTALQVREMNSALKKSGFFTAVMGIYFAPPFYLAGNEKGREYKSIDIDGKPVNNFDFTLRGTWMDTVVQQALEKGLTLGFDLAISDYEAYFGGERIGFTPHAIAVFRKFFQQRYSAMPWIEPPEIVKTPEKYPEHYKIWSSFKCDQYASYLENVIERARKKAPETKIGWCTISGSSDESIKLDNLQDTARFASFLDYNMPMLYNNLYRSMDNYRNEIELFQKLGTGKPALLLPTLSLGFWGEANSFPPEHSFYILLETALLQCRGAYLFPGFAGSDNLGIKYMSEALDLIAKIEPFLESAKRSAGIAAVSDAENTRLHLPVGIRPLTLVNRNKSLIYIAEYSQDPISLKLRFTLPGRCRVQSLHGQVFSGILESGDTRSLTLNKEKGKGLLLLLETLNGEEFPVKQEKRSTSPSVETQSENGLLFHDSFEGVTQGKNLYDRHFFSFDANGQNGQCLFLRDYESAWILPKEFRLPSGELALDFFFRNTRQHFPGGKMLVDILRGELSGNQIFWLFLDPATGKMVFAIGKQNKKGIDWNLRLLSETDRWPARLWQNIHLCLGASGITLTVDGRKEIESSRGVYFSSMKNLQLGRRWVSNGAYDELRIYNKGKVSGTIEH